MRLNGAPLNQSTINANSSGIVHALTMMATSGALVARRMFLSMRQVALVGSQSLIGRLVRVSYAVHGVIAVMARRSIASSFGATATNIATSVKRIVPVAKLATSACVVGVSKLRIAILMFVASGAGVAGFVKGYQASRQFIAISVTQSSVARLMSVTHAVATTVLTGMQRVFWHMVLTGSSVIASVSRSAKLLRSFAVTSAGISSRGVWVLIWGSARFVIRILNQWRTRPVDGGARTLRIEADARAVHIPPENRGAN